MLARVRARAHAWLHARAPHSAPSSARACPHALAIVIFASAQLRSLAGRAPAVAALAQGGVLLPLRQALAGDDDDYDAQVCGGAGDGSQSAGFRIWSARHGGAATGNGSQVGRDADHAGRDCHRCAAQRNCAHHWSGWRRQWRQQHGQLRLGLRQDKRWHVPCVPHHERDLVWTADLESGRFIAVADRELDPENFYSFAGEVDATGQHIVGNLTAGRVAKGTFTLSRGAAQQPPQPECAPLPPPPAPGSASSATVWPMPMHFERGPAVSTLQVSGAPDFEFLAADGSGSAALAAAFRRFMPLCFPHRAGMSGRGGGRGSWLRKLTVKIADQSAPTGTPVMGVDESYNLTLPPPGEADSGGVLEAVTVFGAYHGLQSFSQLVTFDFDTVSYRVVGAPIRIVDAPRFGWREIMVRGCSPRICSNLVMPSCSNRVMQQPRFRCAQCLLAAAQGTGVPQVDTARHFLPVPVMRQVVDSMVTAKFNVLHVHWVDTQAFPLVLPSAPRLARGAWSKEERYTLAEVKALREYASARGVRIVAEIVRSCTRRVAVRGAVAAAVALTVQLGRRTLCAGHAWARRELVHRDAGDLPEPLVPAGGAHRTHTRLLLLCTAARMSSCGADPSPPTPHRVMLTPCDADTV